MGDFTGWLKKLWDIEVNAYHSLKTAIALDKNGTPVMVTDSKTGEKVAKTNVSIWFKASLVPIIIFAVIVLFVWSFFNKTNPRDKRISHHGINRYGERY